MSRPTSADTVRAMRQLVNVGAVVAFGIALTISAGVMRPTYESDAVRDWLSVAAVVGEGTPADTLDDLGRAHLGVGKGDYPHPRLPGGLLLQMPLLLVDGLSARAMMDVIVVLSISGLAWAATRINGWRPFWIIPLGFAMILSPWGISSLAAGSQGPVVAFLIAFAWLRRNGVPLGLAATLKVFPGLLIPMLWMAGQRRLAYQAAATFTAVNLLGLLLPDVGLGQFGTLISPNQGLSHNMSLELPLLVSALGVVTVIAVSRFLPEWAVWVVGSAAMLMFSPTVWVHYLLILAVPALVLVRKVWGLASRPVTEDDESGPSSTTEVPRPAAPSTPAAGSR